MQLLYDEEGDILDVIFKEGEHNTAYAGYELRRGVVLYVTADMEPVQLTVVNFQRLTKLPMIHFNLLETQPKKRRVKLLSIISSPPLSSLLRIDPKTNYGHLMSPAIVDVFAKAA